jgi:soluble lytic murein transglycosylase-like protein
MTYYSIIFSAAKAAKVSGVLLYAICAHESRDFVLDYSQYDGGSPSYSVCQIKESTAKMFGFKGNPMKLRDAETGIKYAAFFLKYQQSRYGQDDWLKLVSSYNYGTYIENDRKLKCPKNERYVELVKNKLPKELRYKLECENGNGKTDQTNIW